MPLTLPIPPQVESDANGAEVLRVFIAHKASHVVFNTGAFADGGMWGMLMADVMGHVLRGLTQANPNIKPEDVRGAVMEVFNTEIKRVLADLATAPEAKTVVN